MADKGGLRDVEFLYEVGTMRHTKRMWTQTMSCPYYANLAEHTLRVMWIALMLAERSGKDYDRGRLMTFALCHDLGELRTGDTTILHKRYVKKDEALAVEDILTATSLKPLVQGAHHDYEVRECIESHFVKDADTLDVDMELVEQSEHRLQAPEIIQLRKDLIRTKLYTDVAKEIFDAIYTTPARAWLVRLSEEFEARQSNDPVVKLRA